jgi:hypothetical protein
MNTNPKALTLLQTLEAIAQFDPEKSSALPFQQVAHLICLAADAIKRIDGAASFVPGPNDERYQRLSSPQPAAQAEVNVRRFCAELEAIREVCHLRDVHLILATPCVKDGKPAEILTSLHLGNSATAWPMLLNNLLHLKAERDQEVLQLLEFPTN